MRARLTHRAIRSAEHHGKGAFYIWDTETSGFGVQVYRSGKRTFLVTYSVGGTRRFFKLGEYGELTIEQARKAAWEVQARVLRGEDPSAERQALRGAPTMENLAERYMTDYAEIHKKPAVARKDQKSWERDLVPLFGPRKVAEITHDDIAKMHADNRNRPGSANNILWLLSKAFNLAEVWGWRPEGSNPCRRVHQYPMKKRERYLSQKELGRLSEVLLEAESWKSVKPRAIAGIRLLIFTGCRSGEITNLRWDDIDWENGLLHLPDSKTGPKKVRLNEPALEVLRGIERVEGSPWVVPGHDPSKPRKNFNSLWIKIRHEAKIEDVRLHDLRHTFASFAINSGIALPVISKLLGHRAVSTTARYAHLDDAPIRDANEKIGSQLVALLEGKA